MMVIVLNIFLQTKYCQTKLVDLGVKYSDGGVDDRNDDVEDDSDSSSGSGDVDVGVENGGVDDKNIVWELRQNCSSVPPNQQTFQS